VNYTKKKLSECLHSTLFSVYYSTGSEKSDVDFILIIIIIITIIITLFILVKTGQSIKI